MACSNYIEKSGNKCPDAFVIDAALQPSKMYNWEFKGKFNNKYVGNSFTDGDGILTIPVDGDVLTQDLFQPFSGIWEFRLSVTDETGSPQPFLFCGNYDLVVLSFENITPLPEPNNYQIAIECPAL